MARASTTRLYPKTRAFRAPHVSGTTIQRSRHGLIRASVASLAVSNGSSDAERRCRTGVLVGIGVDGECRQNAAGTFSLAVLNVGVEFNVGIWRGRYTTPGSSN
jgi:hypothetical protein